MIGDLGARSVLTALLPLVLLGCAGPQYAAHWNELQPGMTHREVEALLGEPTARVRIEGAAGRLVRERWQYGESGPDASIESGLGFSSPDDVFVVSFGTDGRVSDFRRPLVGKHAEPPG
jgi:hypothetical protein